MEESGLFFQLGLSTERQQLGLDGAPQDLQLCHRLEFVGEHAADLGDLGVQHGRRRVLEDDRGGLGAAQLGGLLVRGGGLGTP
eukprot:7065253-Pyramimonas_sp.AAC.1